MAAGINESRIHFCYKKWLVHPHEQVNIHINTSRKASTVQIVRNHRMTHFLSVRDSLLAPGGHLDVVWRETPKFKMLYLKDGGCYRAKNLQQRKY